MNNLFIGIKHLSVGAAAVLSPVLSSGVSHPTPKPTPTPILAIVQKDTITKSGEYSYSGHTLKYTLNIPKNGGDINGNFSGACEGPISGKFAGGEGGNVEGQSQANCKVAIFSYNLKAQYTGKLYLNRGKVDLNWEGQIPYTKNKGSVTINFQPL